MTTNRTIKSFLFLIGFLTCVNVQAQQIERLLCEPAWWQSNPSGQALKNATRSIQAVFQICNSNNDRPVHIVLRLEEPLSRSQWAFLMTVFTAESNSLFLRNRRGETPLILVSLRIGRMLEELDDLGFDAEPIEITEFFSNFYLEASLYVFMRMQSGDLLEDVVNEIMAEITLIGLGHLFRQEEFLEELREYLEYLENQGPAF